IGDGLHSASYTLSHHGESLGELELRFRRRPDEGALQSAEDLLALAIPALRNALTHQSVCRQVARLERALHSTRRAGDSAGAAVVPLHPKPDAPAVPSDEAAAPPWE